MGKRTGKPRGRPSIRMMPDPIPATPEELARALFSVSPAPPVAPEPPEPLEEPSPPQGRRGGDSNP